MAASMEAIGGVLTEAEIALATLVCESPVWSVAADNGWTIASVLSRGGAILSKLASAGIPADGLRERFRAYCDRCGHLLSHDVEDDLVCPSMKCYAAEVAAGREPPPPKTILFCDLHDTERSMALRCNLDATDIR